MWYDNLLNLAREAGQKRARPLESCFPVGAAFQFSNNQVKVGVNYEDAGKTPVGTCAERSTLQAANNEFGPLSDRGLDSGVTWVTGALWAGTPLPPAPCGICRDALAGAGHPDALVVSQGNGKDRLRATIEELLPLAGRGKNGDVSAELERWAERGAPVSESLPAGAEIILAAAQEASDRSYLPPFTKQPPAGAAIELADYTVITGWVVTDATTRLGGSAIAMAVRRMLEGPCSPPPQVLRVALFTNAEILRAPNGYDLQSLQEIAAPETQIIFGCLPARKFSAPLSALLPEPFGRRDLGY